MPSMSCRLPVKRWGGLWRWRSSLRYLECLALAVGLTFVTSKAGGLPRNVGMVSVAGGRIGVSSVDLLACRRCQRRPRYSTMVRAQNAVIDIAPPQKLSPASTAVELRSPNGNKLLLLGTAHVSARDADVVRSTVAEVRPDAVVLELDERRLPRLNVTMEELGDLAIVHEKPPIPSSESFAPFDPRGWAAAAAAPLIRSMMTSMYDGMTAKGMQAGGEFAAAIDMGRQVGSRLVLGDIDSVETIEAFLRNVARTNPLDIMQRYSTVMREELGSVARSDEITPELVEKMRANVAFNARVFERLKTEVPEFYDTFIRARDSCLAASIRAEDARGSQTIVAVVGLGHVRGIEDELAYSGWRRSN